MFYVSSLALHISERKYAERKVRERCTQESGDGYLGQEKERDKMWEDHEMQVRIKVLACFGEWVYGHH